MIHERSDSSHAQRLRDALEGKLDGYLRTDPASRALWSTDGGWILTTPPYDPGSDYARALELVGSKYIILHKDGSVYDSVDGWNMDTPSYYPGSGYARDLEIQ